ncbi:MAG: TetR/AcrR family transcriptional regulator [Rectinema sp.]
MDGAIGQSGQILDFATRSFFRYGYSSVTIDEIVAELRMSKATFYRFFESKEELLGQVIHSYSDKIMNTFSLNKAYDSRSYIELFKNLTKFIAETLGQIDARARNDIRSSAPKLWKSLQDLQHRSVSSVLTSFFRVGKECGLLRPEIDPEVAGELLAMTLESLLSGEARKNSGLSRMKALQSLADMLMNGSLATPQQLRA